MKQDHHKEDLDTHFITPICWLGSILGIVPINKFQIKKYDESTVQTYYKLYAGFILLLIIIGSSAALIGRINEVYDALPSSTLVITDITIQISTILVNVVSVLAPTFWNLKSYNDFISKLLNPATCVQQNNFVRMERCKAFYRKLLLGHTVLIFIFVCDAYVWIDLFGMKVYRHYIFRDIQNYHVFGMAMIMYNFALAIEYRFQVLNESLKSIASPHQIRWATILINSEKIQKSQDVRQITKMYATLIEQINLFNEVFGWQILFLMFTLMMGLLNTFDILTVFTVLGKGIEGAPKYLAHELVILTIIWTTWLLVLGVIITASCKHTIKEAQSTADICFNLILKFPAMCENPEEKSCKRELHLLKQLVIQRAPNFSAAGFYTVNYSLLLALFGSVTSYVIVLIQFNK